MIIFFFFNFVIVCATASVRNIINPNFSIKENLRCVFNINPQINEEVASLLQLTGSVNMKITSKEVNKSNEVVEDLKIRIDQAHQLHLH